MRARWPVAAVLAFTAALYLRSIGTFPIYIGGDEARFAAAASSIASTGRDLSGVRLPLFFHMSDTLASDAGVRWYQPLLFYLMAVVFRVAPVTEGSMRVPTALIGVLDVFLVYVVARRIWGDRRLAALAAALLALSPAHFIFSRQGLDYICPLPFVLGWLWCLLRAVESGRARWSFACGVLLGAGSYSYIASWAMMPLLLLLTWIAQSRSIAHAARSNVAATLGFGLPILVAIVWLPLHPEMWRDTAGRYNVFTYGDVRERVSVYWDYFNPAFLFLSGGSNLSTATRQAGVFLVPMAVFLAAGIYDLWRRHPSATSAVLVGGFVAAPVPATLVHERYAVQRELVVLPFAALIAACGTAFLLRHSIRAVRAAAVVLLLAMPLQFALFLHDYFADYSVRSAFAFDPSNFRDVAEYLIADHSPEQTPAIFLSAELDDVAARWRFYLVKHQREDLLRRTSLFTSTGFDVGDVPSGSLLVLSANDPNVAVLIGQQQCAVATYIHDVTGGRSAVILRKAS